MVIAARAEHDLNHFALLEQLEESLANAKDESFRAYLTDQIEKEKHLLKLLCHCPECDL